MRREFDIPGVFRDFLRGRLQERRATLMKEFSEVISQAPPEVKALLAEVGQACMERSHSPVQVLSMGLIYGLALGVLVKERNQKIQ